MAVLVLLIGFAVGTKLAIDAASLPHGYFVGFFFWVAWVLSLIVAGIGLLLCIPRVTRFAGMLVAMTGLLLLSSFYLVFFTLRQLGHVKFPDPEPMVELGPNVRAGLLICFSLGRQTARL